jgi:hypothetical protein
VDLSSPMAKFFFVARFCVSAMPRLTDLLLACTLAIAYWNLVANSLRMKLFSTPHFLRTEGKVADFVNSTTKGLYTTRHRNSRNGFSCGWLGYEWIRN